MVEDVVEIYAHLEFRTLAESEKLPQSEIYSPRSGPDERVSFRNVSVVENIGAGTRYREGSGIEEPIATYARVAREAGAKVTIVSSDKDLMQLIVDGVVEMLDTMKSKRIGPTEVFERFTRATNRIEEITRDDASFKSAPLFTKNAALSGNPVAEATGLVARLEQHAALAASLQAAKLTPREYAKFALGLVAAHLAYDLVKSGVLLQIPSGAPAMNIEFMKTHESDVIATLVRLGIRD